MTFHKGLLLAACFVQVALFSGCTPTDGTTAEGGTGGAATGVNTAGFLSTVYKPLLKWLDDERFEVDYKHMTPQLIFDQVPLNDIFYETSNLPTKAAPFNFTQASVSRRELLKRIADHWKLKMSFSVDASGKPTAVKVEG